MNIQNTRGREIVSRLSSLIKIADYSAIPYSLETCAFPYSLETSDTPIPSRNVSFPIPSK